MVVCTPTNEWFSGCGETHSPKQCPWKPLLGHKKIGSRTTQPVQLREPTEHHHVPRTPCSHSTLRASLSGTPLLKEGCRKSVLGVCPVHLSEGADRVGGQQRGDEECPFSGATKSGRGWRKVPESGARSVFTELSLSLSLGLCSTAASVARDAELTQPGPPRPNR